MRMWWNGIHSGLKIRRRKLASSNLASRTKILQEHDAGQDGPSADRFAERGGRRRIAYCSIEKRGGSEAAADRGIRFGDRKSVV